MGKRILVTFIITIFMVFPSYARENHTVMRVANVNNTEKIITFVDRNGDRFEIDALSETDYVIYAKDYREATFYDYYVGRIANVVIDDNGTKNPKDDKIVMVKLLNCNVTYRN